MTPALARAMTGHTPGPWDDYVPPMTLWAWPFNPGWGGYWRQNMNAVPPESHGAMYVREGVTDTDLAADNLRLRSECLTLTDENERLRREVADLRAFCKGAALSPW